MNTKDEFIKEVSHHAFIEILECGIMGYVKQAMDNYAESQNKELQQQLEKERIENTVLKQKLVLANKSTRYPNGI